MFNNYPNYSYNNNYAMPQYQQQYAQMQQQAMRQPQQQPIQQPQMQVPYEIPIQDVRFVTSEEAKAFIVMPNTKALLIDRQNGIALLKSADNLGQSVTNFFKFIPVNADGTPIAPVEAQPQFNLDDLTKRFATIEQFNDLNTKMERLINEKELITSGKKATKEQ